MNLKELYHKIVSEIENAHISNPDLEGRILIEHFLGKNGAFIISHPDFEVEEDRLSKIQKALEKRKKGFPIAYITGHKEFFGLDFLVNKDVLIPRPETEFLVEEAIKMVERSNKKLKILDMGTGSGCIIISLAKNIDGDFYAADNSKKALLVAAKNAKRVTLNNIKFINSDLFANRLLHKKFGLIIANLPYVPTDESPESEIINIKAEPRNAIFADKNGTSIIKIFLEEAKNRLNPGGTILIELDPRNADYLLDTAKNLYSNAEIDLEKDLAGHKRYLKIRS